MKKTLILPSPHQFNVAVESYLALDSQYTLEDLCKFLSIYSEYFEQEAKVFKTVLMDIMEVYNKPEFESGPHEVRDTFKVVLRHDGGYTWRMLKAYGWTNKLKHPLFVSNMPDIKKFAKEFRKATAKEPWSISFVWAFRKWKLVPEKIIIRFNFLPESLILVDRSKG